MYELVIDKLLSSLSTISKQIRTRKQPASLYYLNFFSDTINEILLRLKVDILKYRSTTLRKRCEESLDANLFVPNRTI